MLHGKLGADLERNYVRRHRGAYGESPSKDGRVEQANFDTDLMQPSRMTLVGGLLPFRDRGTVGSASDTFDDTQVALSRELEIAAPAVWLNSRPMAVSKSEFVAGGHGSNGVRAEMAVSICGSITRAIFRPSSALAS